MVQLDHLEKWLYARGFRVYWPRGFSVPARIADFRGNDWRVFVEEHQQVHMSLDDVIWLRKVLGDMNDSM